MTDLSSNKGQENRMGAKTQKDFESIKHPCSHSTNIESPVGVRELGILLGATDTAMKRAQAGMPSCRVHSSEGFRWVTGKYG